MLGSRLFQDKSKFSKMFFTKIVGLSPDKRTFWKTNRNLQGRVSLRKLIKRFVQPSNDRVFHGTKRRDLSTFGYDVIIGDQDTLWEILERNRWFFSIYLSFNGDQWNLERDLSCDTIYWNSNGKQSTSHFFSVVLRKQPS